jgi:hypothetical protein
MATPHPRFGRSKERVMRVGSLRASESMISSWTRGVAVAVRASTGVPGARRDRISAIFR